jgi:TolB-like protein
MSDASKAVFLSYASQDADVARMIADALRGAGVEVWFDQNELVGGDAWDAKIRRQIKECALFVPVISAATQARPEGYFRLEWKLAADRSHLIARDHPFVVPVVIDDTNSDVARLPEEFHAVQWTRLRPAQGGQARDDASLAAFCTQVQRLLGGTSLGPGRLRPGERGEGAASLVASRSARRISTATFLSLAAVAILAIGGYFLFNRGTFTRDSAAQRIAPPTPEKPAPAADDKSLVVLPLENLSPDPENAFFTDGMHAEIIATLARIADLKKVISRESALALRGASISLAEKARKVGVAHVISGSVRRAGNEVRISLELRRARDESLLWSQTYDKQIGEGVLAIQTDIADQVARVLQARERKGTYAGARTLARDARAYDLFLKARHLFDTNDLRSSTLIATLEEALRIDPTFMSAAALLSTTHSRLRGFWNQDAPTRAHHAAEAKRWADAAARLVPGGAGDGPLAVYFGLIEHDYVRALSYAENVIHALPNEATGYDYAAKSLAKLGRFSEAVALGERAISLDPLNPLFRQNQLAALTSLRWAPAAFEALARYQALLPPGRKIYVAESTHYRLNGVLPADGSADQTTSTFLWRMRKFDELLVKLDRLQEGQITDKLRFVYLQEKSRALQRLGQREKAVLAAEAALELARKPALDTDDAPDAQDIRRAQALALLGRADEAIATGRRCIEAKSGPNQLLVRWELEYELAEIYATLNRPRECCELLGKLLRVPSGVTVPQLKVHPDWDNVREDAAFKALLADPKNSAPL